MSDAELMALAALVMNEAAEIYANAVKYGDILWNPDTPSRRELYEEVVRRRSVSAPAPGGPAAEGGAQ